MSMRERLPDTREGATLRFRIISNATDGTGLCETKGYIVTSTYAEDKRLGEIFIKVGKPGSSEALCDQFAIACSIALQRGASVDELLQKFVGTRFEPSGAVKDVEGILRCTSPLDLVARWILQKYGKKES
jgi:ribonucleoside-diphosphate reductase alpha chain